MSFPSGQCLLLRLPSFIFSFLRLFVRLVGWGPLALGGCLSFILLPGLKKCSILMVYSNNRKTAAVHVCVCARTHAEAKTLRVPPQGSSHLRLGDPKLLEVHSRDPMTQRGRSRAVSTEASLPGRFSHGHFWACLPHWWRIQLLWVSPASATPPVFRKGENRSAEEEEEEEFLLWGALLWGIKARLPSVWGSLSPPPSAADEAGRRVGATTAGEEGGRLRGTPRSYGGPVAPRRGSDVADPHTQRGAFPLGSLPE